MQLWIYIQCSVNVFAHKIPACMHHYLVIYQYTKMYWKNDWVWDHMTTWAFLYPKWNKPRERKHEQTTSTTHLEKVGFRKRKLCHKGVLLFIFLKWTNSLPSSTWTDLIWIRLHLFHVRVRSQARLDFNSVGNIVLAAPNTFLDDKSDGVCACVQGISRDKVKLRTVHSLSLHFPNVQYVYISFLTRNKCPSKQAIVIVAWLAVSARAFDRGGASYTRHWTL